MAEPTGRHRLDGPRHRRARRPVGAARRGARRLGSVVLLAALGGLGVPAVATTSAAGSAAARVHDWLSGFVAAEASAGTARSPLGWPAVAPADQSAHSVVVVPAIMGMPGSAHPGPPPQPPWVSRGRGGEPVLWDACQPIHYRIAGTAAQRELVEASVQTLRITTGIPFIAEPAVVDAVPRWGATRTDPASGSRVWSPVQVSVVDTLPPPHTASGAITAQHSAQSREVPSRRAGQASAHRSGHRSGIAGLSVLTVHDEAGMRVQVVRGDSVERPVQYKSGRILIEQTLLAAPGGQWALLHAWGHVLGLAEVDRVHSDSATTGPGHPRPRPFRDGDGQQRLMTPLPAHLAADRRPSTRSLVDASATWPAGLSAELTDPRVVPRWLTGADLWALARTGRGTCDASS